jgi:hypothetical protein
MQTEGDQARCGSGVQRGGAAADDDGVRRGGDGGTPTNFGSLTA